MSTQQIHVFISHSWAYSSHYETLAGWIFDQPWSVGQASLDLRDFSVPQSHPVHNARNDTQLREALYRNIARSHVIVIPTGMYAAYSQWIQKEIDGAGIYGKPILAVNPWGAQRTSSDVKAVADAIVGWNSESVVGGIWKLFRR